jgi:hypothetical protein
MIRSRTGRRNVLLGSVGLVVVLPLVAWFAAPTAQAADAPAANLAGLNANAYATAMQFIPLAKGLVPAGNLSTGDFFQISVPYANASSETGPSSTAIGTPMYPGPVAIALPGALQTEGFPAQFAALFADPVVAQAAYPPEPGRGASATYTPPSGSQSGVGPAKATAADSGSSAQAATNDTLLAGGQIEIGSSTTDSTTTIGASSISDVAHSFINRISILHGLVQIASITSNSTASSNGSVGSETSSLQIGAVTVAGQAAYIAPDGLHLAKTSNGLGNLVSTFNSALSALEQAGITVTTVSPSSNVQGTAASVDSGAVQIKFIDQNIPSPEGVVPLNLIGAEIDLGLTHADAQATVVPGFGSTQFQSSPLPGASSSGGASPSTPVASAGGGGAASSVALSPGGGFTTRSSSAGAGTTGSTSGQPGGVLPAAATVMGIPTRMAWVVAAILLSIVASGPLLGYANWQLIRGRRT